MSENEILAICNILKRYFRKYIKDSKMYVKPYDCEKDLIKSPYGYLQYSKQLNVFIIKYNQNETRDEILNTILHEFSHVVLGHLNRHSEVLNDRIVFDSGDNSPIYAMMEHQANVLMGLLKDTWFILDIKETVA